MTKLTQQYLKEIFDYKNGNLYWKKLTSKFSNGKINDKAGYIHHTGYQIIGINNKYYSVHRLIFLYYYGYLPKEIDHIDGNRGNNHIGNLREVTRSQNLMNSKSHKNSSSQYKGVTWHKRDKKWQVTIRINGKNKYLESFDNEIDAALTYNTKAIKLYGDYANLNIIGSN